jgi:signal transduction histidine kinase
MLASFETLESAIDAVVGLAAETLSARSAIMIETGHGLSRAIARSSADVNEDRMQAATSRARTVCACLMGGVRLDKIESKCGYLDIPLAVTGKAIFGVLQFESVRPFDESDLIFTHAIANELAAAIDRAYAWQLEVARCRRAEAARAERERILAVVSHDLRNPLQVIAMSANMLRDPGDSDEQAKGPHRIERAGHRMHRMIEDLLDFSSLEAGSLRINTQPEDAASLVAEAVDALNMLVVEKDVRLLNEVGAPLPSVRCDRDRILQVIANVAGNAIKVVSRGGSVAIRAEAREHDVIIAIADTGPGIADADLQRIFEPYWRADTAAYKGTGLGLAIASEIVTAHGGRIWAESRLGHGATFFFTLPIAEDTK